MKRLLLFAAFATLACGARAPRTETMEQLRERVFQVARHQAVFMDSLLPEGRCPKTFQDGEPVTSDIGWWCSGFYPGVLWTLASRMTPWKDWPSNIPFPLPASRNAKRITTSASS